MSSAPTRRITPQQYLEFERKAETKHEFYRGEIFAMAGASRAHNKIAGNFYALVWTALRDRPCEVYGPDMRVKVHASGLYTYPDLSALCDQPQFDDNQVDTLLNPSLLVEVLSPSTENYDRGGKFELYRQIPSLCEYLIVAQDRVFVAHHTRQDDGSWRLMDYRGVDDEIELKSIDCCLLLAEIYEKVEFSEDSTPSSTNPLSATGKMPNSES